MHYRAWERARKQPDELLLDERVALGGGHEPPDDRREAVPFAA
jgi:hypothetical protein